MKRSNKVISILVIIAVFIAGYLIGIRYPPSLFISKSGNSILDALTGKNTLLNQTADILENNFYKDINEEQLVNGMVNSLGDQYTVFFNPEESKDLQAEIEGTYAGIGVVISMNASAELPEIITVFQGTPAEQAGLKSGDLIEKVGSTSLKGLSLDMASLKIKGEIGTSVDLTIKRGEQNLTFMIRRENIQIPITETETMDNGKIGYLKFSMFTDNSATEFDKALTQLKQEKVKGIILDLRDNPGGLLEECQKIASNFIPSGVLLWTRNRAGVTEPIQITGHKFDFPLIVLVNNGTASAAEILTGAIKDYDIGKIIGEQTFGKGVIQQLFALPGGYTLKVTVEEYLTPNKTSINDKGITPDIIIQNNSQNPSKDLQLEKAIEILSNQI